MEIVGITCAAIHVSAAAAWFGAMLYSLAVLHPRAARYFRSSEELEEFIATLSQGARWKVLGILGVIAATGAALLFISSPGSRLWWLLMFIKFALFIAALGIFWYASWRLWPRRIFAIADELPRLRRQFRIVGISLVAIAVISIVLGIVAQACRGR